MGSWKYGRLKQLKKIVYSMTDTTLMKIIKDHENRGWSKASEIKKHGYGLGCLMIWKKTEAPSQGVKVGLINDK
ncbi:hypothetical protein V7152_14860 [Neobacillus drentensis]